MLTKFVSRVLVLVCVPVAAMALPLASSSQIVLYEGNGGSQDIVDSRADDARTFRPRTNDEARSLKLLNVRAGCVITAFDDPKGKRTDDFCIIRVKRSSPEYTITTFERSYEDEYVSVSYAGRNGLDGKVSLVRIE